MKYGYLNCRVCGKEYKVCRSCQKDNSKFHWRDVACSPECGEIYFAEILKSRAQETEEESATVEKESTFEAKDESIVTQQPLIIDDFVEVENEADPNN